MQNTPTLADLQRYSVNRAGSAEVLRQSLYDYQVMPAAGANVFTFFANPVGQGQSAQSGAAAGVPKTLADTFMTLPSQLPAPLAFLCESIEVHFEPGSVSTAGLFVQNVIGVWNATANAVNSNIGALNDENAFRQNGYLRFTIGSKDYLIEGGGMGRFPSKTRFEVDAAFSTNGAATSQYAVTSGKRGGRPYFLDAPLALTSGQNFTVSLNFPTAVALPSTFNAKIGIVLDGYLYRNSQ